MLAKDQMLRVSVVFCVLAVLSLILGGAHVLGLSFDLGRALFFILLGLAVITFIAALSSLRGPGLPSS